VRGRELDVRTNAICMILHVLARPGAAPIGFSCLPTFSACFSGYGMAGTRVLESESGVLGEGNEEERNEGRKRERERSCRWR